MNTKPVSYADRSHGTHIFPFEGNRRPSSDVCNYRCARVTSDATVHIITRAWDCLCRSSTQNIYRQFTPLTGTIILDLAYDTLGYRILITTGRWINFLCRIVATSLQTDRQRDSSQGSPSPRCWLREQSHGQPRFEWQKGERRKGRREDEPLQSNRRC